MSSELEHSAIPVNPELLKTCMYSICIGQDQTFPYIIYIECVAQIDILLITKM